MEFIVIAKDFKDPDAINRRMDVRAEHIRIGDDLVAKGILKYASALINESEQMCGSVMVFDVENRSELDSILEREPYIVGKVWDAIEISRCKIGPSFTKK